MHLIDVRNVYKIYNPGENQVNALDGVSITIDEGEFVAIIGQSGSGKSTLMNMLGLLDTPTEGEYYINGKLVDDLTDDQMSDIRNKQIGFIFQGFNLISSLDALENVELPLVYRGVPRAERDELSKAALEKVGLGGRMHHLPAALSGGQQQRVAVARAIAAAPPVILADEPTGNLDTRSTKDVMQILHNLRMRAERLSSSLTITKSPSRQSALSESETVKWLRITLTQALRKNTAAPQNMIIKTRLIRADNLIFNVYFTCCMQII